MTLSRVFRLLMPIFLLPILAAVIGAVAYAKAKTPVLPRQEERAKLIGQCIKEVGSEVGDSSPMALNEVCTCLTEKLPPGSDVRDFVNTKSGGQTFGRCLFLAKDGL